jgi:hypothetical protein
MDMQNNYRYGNLLLKKDFNTTPPILMSYVPVIADIDYESGYIIRHFAQKANDDNGVITEISENNQIEIKMDGYYKVVSIKWRISGNPQEIMDSNKISIQLVYSQMKNLKSYLSNLLQFAKVK